MAKSLVSSGNRAAIYTRISKDPTGKGAGVARQESDCRKLATERGWEIIAAYSDNDISAYSGKPRPQYRAMLDAIRDGQIDIVICWHTDRLYRRVSDLEEYIEVCQPRKVPTHAVQAGHLDLTTPSGRWMARQLGSMAQYEVEQKSERQKAANRDRAAAGKHSHAIRPFGYEKDGKTLIPAEAEAIRWAFEYIESGGPIRQVAARWNEAGLRTTQKQREWDSVAVRTALGKARYGGMRSYLGEIVRDDNGEPVQADAPAIVSREQWEAVQRIFADPSRRTNPGNSQRGLLSGIATCAECGLPIVSGGTRKTRSGETKHKYRCATRAQHACRQAEPIDAYIEDLLVARLSRDDTAELLTATGEPFDLVAVRSEIEGLHARSGQLAEAFADGEIDQAAFRRGTERARLRIEELEQSIPLVTTTPAVRALADADDVRAAWHALAREEQRAVVRALMAVEIHSPTGTRKRATISSGGRKVANPETVTVRWL